MGLIKRFEDIKAWQRAREFTRLLYTATSVRPFRVDVDFRKQMRRASVSIMANIAEGFGRHSDREFANFLNIARGSALEVQSHLYVALDLNYLSREQFDEFYQIADEISRMIFTLQNYLRKQSRVKYSRESRVMGKTKSELPAG